MIYNSLNIMSLRDRHFFSTVIVSHINRPSMFKSYFKTAWRFLMKNKTFGFINVFGLTLGTLCCIYILLYVTDQFSYDKHHAGARDIYRVVCHYKIKTDGTLQDVSTTSAQTAPVMRQDLPEVVQYTRVIPFPGIDQPLLRYQDRTVYEKAPL